MIVAVAGRAWQIRKAPCALQKAADDQRGKILKKSGRFVSAAFRSSQI